MQNNSGNILDCANIAALCSLCHYRSVSSLLNIAHRHSSRLDISDCLKSRFAVLIFTSFVHFLRWSTTGVRSRVSSSPRLNVIFNLSEFFSIRSIWLSHFYPKGKTEQRDPRTLSTFVSRKIVLLDPSSEEEQQMDGFLAVSRNQRQEICGIQMAGSLGLKREQVRGISSMEWKFVFMLMIFQIAICQKLAYKKAYELTKFINEQVENYFR